MAQSELAQRAASLGEPWLSYYAPDEIEATLRAAGFTTVEFLTPQQAQARYFDPRPADLAAPTRVNIVSALR